MILWLRCSWINISSTNIYQASSLISKMWKQKYYSPYFRAPRDPHRMLTTWKLLWKCNWQNIPSTATRVCTQWCFCQGSSILTFIRSDQTNLLVESHLLLLLVLCWFKNLLQSLLSGTVNKLSPSWSRTSVCKTLTDGLFGEARKRIAPVWPGSDASPSQYCSSGGGNVILEPAESASK